MMFLTAWLAIPAWADLEGARRHLEASRPEHAYREALRCRPEDPEGSELLQIWALQNSLRGDEARQRLRSFRPNPRSARLYLIVHSLLYSESRVKDLNQALDLSQTPADRVDVLLRLFRSHPFPKDQSYWEEAAEIASKHRLSRELLVRLSLAHINLLCSLKRPQEGFADLAVVQNLLGSDSSAPWRLQSARIELLNALGRSGEAQESRAEMPLLVEESAPALLFLLNLAESRSELDRERGGHLLSKLERIRARDRNWDLRKRLLAFRIRSLVAQNNPLRFEEWRREADQLCASKNADERLIGLSERGVLEAAHGQPEAALKDLKAAFGLAQRPAGSEVFALAQPMVLSTALAQLELSQKRYGEAESWGRQAAQAAGEDFNAFLGSSLTLLGVYLRTAQLQSARQTLDSILARAETVDAPLSRALAYSQVFTTLMMSSFDANRHLAGPLVPPRVDPDTPAGWMFAELRQDVRLQARIFAALDDLKKQSNHPALRGAEGLFRGMVLGSLDRPLEAIDAYSQALEAESGYSPLEANTALMLSQELWSTGSRQRALEMSRLAFQQSRKGSVFLSPGIFRLILLRQLLESGQPEEALKLLDEGLADAKDSYQPIYLIVRGQAYKRVEDLKRALETATQDVTRNEAYLALQQLDPAGNWLSHVSARSPRLALRLMADSSPERALEIGHEALEQFRETFEQLPTSARPQALRSPGLQALMEAILEASIRAGRPQEGAHCLAVWRALQSQPALVSPELEQLRAELTGLRSSSDPASAARLADTRAQFLLKTNELRQLNPDMEKSMSAQVSELLALQPFLDTRTVLVQYYLAPDGVYIQALTREEQRLAKITIEKPRLLSLLERWRGALRKPSVLSAEEREASRLLYSQLIQPLASLRVEHPNLWLMPSSELWDLPFESLLDENEHYLVESGGCAYLGPSEAMQLALPVAAAAGRWLGVSNARLPGTQAEVAALARLFPDGRRTESWAELKELAPQARFLHLATHSQAFPSRATDNYVELSEGPVPMEQIYGLALPAGSLVVLSSCSGAQAQEHRERDLISLSSGFRAAGAASVVAALWPIDDEVTASFFLPMYQALLSGQSRLEALRQAKLSCLRQHPHPYYWAGFTLLGDPR
ncbi:MAG: CHAT domain-containing protein [Candidatus Eremiobacteraeota bacterium]|nr:CHAT domain-containing protein [Candidatus Eremiobacteraeota bacterium]